MSEISDLTQLCKQVATHFDGWTLVEDGESFDGRWKLRRDGMEICLRLDWAKKDRLTVKTWGWPSYKDDSRIDKVIVYPRDLSPREADPDISVAWARGAEVIAKEIKRRFLPEYERIYALALAKATRAQEQINEARANWEAACKVIGASPSGNVHYVESNGKRDLTVENRNGSTYISTYVTPEQLAHVVKALRGEL